MARLRKGRLRWAIAGGLVVALAVALIVAWPLLQSYTGAAPPAQFYEKAGLDPAPAQQYTRVLGVAHNAGNNAATLATALRYGADVIEIDVISPRRQLVAGRARRGPPAEVRPSAADGHRRCIGVPGPGRCEPGRLGAPAQAADPGMDGERRPACQPAGPAGRRRHHHGEPRDPPGPRVTAAQ